MLIIEVICGVLLLPDIGVVKYVNDPPKANLTVSVLCIVVLIVSFIMYKRSQDKKEKWSSIVPVKETLQKTEIKDKIDHLISMVNQIEARQNELAGLLEEIKKSANDVLSETFNDPSIFTSIGNVKMSSKLRNILDANKIYTLEEASRYAYDFKKLRRVGNTTYKELLNILEKHSLIE